MVSFSSALNFIPYDEFNNNFILEKKENKAKQKASEYRQTTIQHKNLKCKIRSVIKPTVPSQSCNSLTNLKSFNNLFTKSFWSSS
ncbi:unnamed protein product [Rotaria socialis]